MAVNLTIPPASDIHPVTGVEIGIAAAGVRKPGRPDLTVFYLAPGCSVAAVFTTNRFRAAPVQVAEQHLADGSQVRALVINTGNANAGTGQPGLDAAIATCEALGGVLGAEARQILPYSTGVILEPLPVDRIIQGIPKAVDDLRADNWLAAAHSIMTTDTQPKITSTRIELNQRPVVFTGISKGAGMIRPNMATMLGFVATDAWMPPALLNEVVRRVADRSFNRITVDGDTSTNDAFTVIATGQSGVRIEDASDPRLPAVEAALTEVARTLATNIVRDAEGATKFITVRVEGARDSAEALKVAYSVAQSPLVKTAFYASDPNLGRILCAIGYAGVTDLDTAALTLWLDDVRVARDGGRDPDYREEDGQRVMQQAEITVRIDLGRGDVAETVYTCDFSHEYVSINADYRS